MKIAILGPVGVGKGTQAQRLTRTTLANYTRVSTGDLIRDHIEADTEIGREAKRSYDRGEPVPDGLVMDLVLPHLQPAGFWVLDDFPLNLGQARALDAALEGRKGGLTHVLVLEGPSDDELVARVLSGRRTSLATGMVYHLESFPPPSPVEHTDAGPFARRSDDTEEALRRGLEGYHREADALKNYYEKGGVLHVVDARGSVEEVFERVLDALNLSRPEGSRGPTDRIAN